MNSLITHCRSKHLKSRRSVALDVLCPLPWRRRRRRRTVAEFVGARSSWRPSGKRFSSSSRASPEFESKRSLLHFRCLRRNSPARSKNCSRPRSCRKRATGARQRTPSRSEIAPPNVEHSLLGPLPEQPQLDSFESIKRESPAGCPTGSASLEERSSRTSRPGP